MMSSTFLNHRHQCALKHNDINMNCQQGLVIFLSVLVLRDLHDGMMSSTFLHHRHLCALEHNAINMNWQQGLIVSSVLILRYLHMLGVSDHNSQLFMMASTLFE